MNFPIKTGYSAEVKTVLKKTWLVFGPAVKVMSNSVASFQPDGAEADLIEEGGFASGLRTCRNRS